VALKIDAVSFASRKWVLATL